MGRSYHSAGHGWPWVLWMLTCGIVSLLFFALLIGAVIAFIQVGGGGEHGTRVRGSSGLEVLEERYARGEIDRDEYLRKKHDITDRGAVA